MHLKNPLLFGLMAILLLGGTITPAISQNTPDLQIVINEVEINPPGSDAGLGSNSSGKQEFIELYNPTSQSIDIGGWEIIPSAYWKTYEIPDNTIITPNSFLVFTHVNFWFKDFGENITLVDDLGDIIDETPLLKDTDDDARSWQRSSDGFDTNSDSNWELKRMTPISSNGKIVESITDELFIFTGTTDKVQYVFGDSLNISGTISEKLTVKNSIHLPEMIKIVIQGSSYYKNLTLFPRDDLNFGTSLNIQPALGFKEGTYDVKMLYGDYSVQNTFDIVDEQTSSSESVSEFLEITTDKNSYIPGETVILTAETNSKIEFAGLEYTVTDPNGKLIFEGTIFQNERFSTVHEAGGGELYPFSAQLMMSLVNPVYGLYEVNGIFKDALGSNAYSTESIESSTTFRLIEDAKEDIPISIISDKEYYSIDDTIKITGRSNDLWVETLNLEVQQTGALSVSDIQGKHMKPFGLVDSVRLNGDGTFDYEFKLVENTGGSDSFNHVMGDYKVKVSASFGDASVYFKVVDDPESFVEERTPLGLKSNNSEVVLGSSIIFSGKVLDYEYLGNQKSEYVDFTFYDPAGNLLVSEERGNRSTNDYGEAPNTKFTIRATPDSLGVYEVTLILHPIQFEYGTYTAQVTHPSNKITESIQFKIKSAQSEILAETSTEEPITMKLCKSDRAHVNEILKDLKTIGRGEIPPSMESVDCSDNVKFATGDKLVVIGKVVLKDPRSLDQSSTKTSGQTQEGSSYSTNYAHSVMNYVDVSIPYPTSLIYTPSSSYATTPNEGEDFTGGGGSGEGGAYYRDADGNVVRPDTAANRQCEASAGVVCAPTKRADRQGEGSYDGTAILQAQKLLLTEMKYKAYPDTEGNFATVFDLRAGVFHSGTYAVKANYFGYNTSDSILVHDTSLKGGLEPSISLTLNKDEFIPGESVRINGLINNIYYFDSVSVKIETPDVSKINCLQGQQCGFGNTAMKLRVSESIEGPKFFWNYKIPNTAASVGSYTVIADTHFGQTKKQFFVVNESEVIGTLTPEATTTISKKIIEKFNRIADDKISIILTEKSTDDSTLTPRVIQGSLFTSARGEESDVNLRITTSNGQCVIGQSSDCLVTESTRKPGAIYSIVTIDDVNYKIRYSGDDVRLEKFSIVPEKSNSKIDIDNWNVEILKDEQPSRFYYKVSYIALE